MMPILTVRRQERYLSNFEKKTKKKSLYIIIIGVLRLAKMVGSSTGILHREDSYLRTMDFLTQLHGVIGQK